MRFVDLDKGYIKNNSCLVEYKGKQFYKYNLGEAVRVLTPTSKHKNMLISENLASKVTNDKLMVQYEPSTNIYFSVDFIEDDNEKNLASTDLDKKTACLLIGKQNEFSITKGVLTFSGWLSANNYVEKDRLIWGNIYTLDNLKNKCHVLGLGVRGDKIFGIYYIPNTRGILLGIKNSNILGLTTTNFKEKSIEGYTSFSIKDWFDGAKIRQL